MNGNMFAFIGQGDVLAFRLFRTDRERFLEQHPSGVVEQHGRVMKDYVAVPGDVLTDPARLEALWASCVANARTLKPKPTTRNQPA